MNCDDDFFGDDNEGNDVATSRKVSSKLFNDGYRIGKAKEEESQMQIGFDQGFEQGMLRGRACGKLYAACREHLSKQSHDGTDVVETLSSLEALLFDGVSCSGQITQSIIEMLRIETLAISAQLEVDFTAFVKDVSLIPQR